MFGAWIFLDPYHFRKDFLLVLGSLERGLTIPLDKYFIKINSD
jgi:hypothetical protein